MIPNRIRVFFPPYTIDDVVELSPYGRVYSDDVEFITREDRSASGKLRRDVIAQKKTFTLQYQTIDQKDLDTFARLIRHHYMVPLYLELMYTGQEQPETYTVLMSPYSRERILAVMGGLWGNVSIVFTEV
jgi:hypothetical protein